MGAKARLERKRRGSVRAGLLTTVVIALMLTFAITAQNGLPPYLPGVDRTTVKVAFTDVGALRAGDDVRIANVRSGFVSSIDLVDGKSIATLKLDGGRPVYEDASVTIGARSSLGQKYVELDPGTKSAGEIRTTIPSDRAASSIELDTVLDTLDAKTREAAGSTVREVGTGLAGRGQDLHDGLGALPQMLPDIGTVAKALSEDGGQDLAQMLRAADTVSRSLTAQEDQIASTTRQVSDTLDAVATDDGQALRDTITAAPEAMTDVKAALDDLNGPLAATRRAVTELRPGAQALGDATPDVRGLLREGVVPLDKVPGVAKRAVPAVERLTPTVRDARPLVQQLGTTFDRAQSPLSILAPYSDEVLLFFQNAASALSQGDAAGRWLRFYPVPTTESVSGALPLRDPTASREAYPAPNTAKDHYESTPLGGSFR